MIRTPPISVDDVDDRRIEPYRAVRDRDLTGRNGRFVAEGEVVVRHLLSERSRFRVESLFVAESRIGALATILNAVPGGVPVYAASRDILDRVVGFPIHRGLLAIGRREPARTEGILPARPARALVLGLVGIANHDNVGGAFRNAAAFGADAVFLDATSCDPLYRKALRVSVGASLIVPFRRCGTADSLIRDLLDGGFGVFALSPAGRHAIEEVAWPRRTALVIGSEGCGLPAAILERLTTVRIGMAAGFDSLNVATASGIALHAVRSGTGLVRAD